MKKNSNPLIAIFLFKKMHLKLLKSRNQLMCRAIITTWDLASCLWILFKQLRCTYFHSVSCKAHHQASNISASTYLILGFKSRFSFFFLFWSKQVNRIPCLFMWIPEEIAHAYWWWLKPYEIIFWWPHNWVPLDPIRKWFLYLHPCKAKKSTYLISILFLQF